MIVSCTHRAHPPPHPTNKPAHFSPRVREAADAVGPFIFREREQMQWAPSCSRPGLASILGRSLPALLAVPNSFPEQSWDNLVFSKSRKHLWRIKKKNGERSKVSRGKSAKSTISNPRGWLFSYSAPALPRTLPQAQAEGRK